ncbi:hypothetical protein APHAL10511_004620 [Amanita phalloides]|nr:hypothetical protein APHAL10511_004620 [Amanita phalloides]
MQLGPVPPSTNHVVHVNPADIPLPAPSDDEFPPPHVLASEIAHPATKTAGSRHAPSSKMKGKQKGNLHDPPVAGKRKQHIDNQPPPVKKQRGRISGATNYSSADIDALFDLIEEHLPLGSQGWNSVGNAFNSWSQENGHPLRTPKSLELKFKQILKTSKPTGDAECTPHVERAHEINELMNQKAGSCDLDDEEILDNDTISIPSDEENVCPRATAHQSGASSIALHITNRVLHAVTPCPRCQVGQEILNTISSALSPAAQQACSEEQNSCSLQATQLFTLNTRICDIERNNDSLCQQLSSLQHELSAAEHCADQAELKLEMQGISFQPSSCSSAQPPRHCIVQKTFYPEGGMGTTVYNEDELDLLHDIELHHDNDYCTKTFVIKDDDGHITPVDSQSGPPSSSGSSQFVTEN